MKKLKYIIMIFLIPFIVAGVIVIKNKNKLTSTVRAFGDLTATYLGIPLGAPVFNVTANAPGDPAETRVIDVKNEGAVTRMVSVKALRTGPPGQADPKIENILHLVLKENGTTKYDGTLAEFFTQSTNPNGFMLSMLTPGNTNNYDFSINFPGEAGNEYQSKSVAFDVTFGYVTGDNIVINEVFYDVDGAHGIDSWKDRGSPKNDKKMGNDDEWIELYNPTNTDVNLKNWTLEDGSGKKVIIHADKTIKAGGFALIAKDESMWKYWNEGPKAVKIQSTDFLGDGLGDLGDHLYLKNNLGAEIDFVAWENDSVKAPTWQNSVNPMAILGHSIERIVAGFDTNVPADWRENSAPTPGL